MQAWNLASPVAEPYREFADRWGNADFSKYVDILEQQADEAMQDADQVHSFAKPFRLQTYVHSSDMLNYLEHRCNTCVQPATSHLIHWSCSELNSQTQRSFMSLRRVLKYSCHSLECIVFLLCSSVVALTDNFRWYCRRSRSQSRRLPWQSWLWSSASGKWPWRLHKDRSCLSVAAEQAENPDLASFCQANRSRLHSCTWSGARERPGIT